MGVGYFPGYWAVTTESNLLNVHSLILLSFLAPCVIFRLSAP